MSTPGENVALEFINVNNNYFELYYIKPKVDFKSKPHSQPDLETSPESDIRLKYINLLQLNKLYQMKVGKSLKKEFSDLFVLYEEIKNSLEKNNFTLIENDNILKIKLKIHQKQHILSLEENYEMATILKKIEEVKEYENKNKINDLTKINVEIKKQNDLLIAENKNLKDELKKVINQSNIYYQNTLKKNKELEIKINSFKDLEKSKNSLLEENISLNNKIKRLTEEKEEIRILKTEMENKYKVLEKDLIDLKKKSDTVNNNSINMENNNLSISLDDFNSIYGTTIQNSTITTLDLNSKKEGNKLIKNLSNMNFQNLEELLLFEDEISDLKSLEKIELNHLKKL